MSLAASNAADDAASHARETIIAKGQKQTNREVRKPKAVKAPAPVNPGSLLTKGTLSPVGMPKKKH